MEEDIHTGIHVIHVYTIHVDQKIDNHFHDNHNPSKKKKKSVCKIHLYKRMVTTTTTIKTMSKTWLMICCIITMSTIINTEAQLSSNIIQLNSKNWKDLEKSPHTWFVNFCRQG